MSIAASGTPLMTRKPTAAVPEWRDVYASTPSWSGGGWRGLETRLPSWSQPAG
jgi:hypothetical protein